MKKLALILALTMFLISCKKESQKEDEQQSETQVTEHKEIYGVVPVKILEQQPYSDWYLHEYESYQLDTATLDSIRGIPFEMTIVMATWCPDSRREVPRMYKILHYLEIPDTSVTLIFVDREKKAGDYDISDLNIERVPTFIIYIGGTEIGRIIETPTETLEKDMAKILKKEENE